MRLSFSFQTVPRARVDCEQHQEAVILKSKKDLLWTNLIVWALKMFTVTKEACGASTDFSVQKFSTISKPNGCR